MKHLKALSQKPAVAQRTVFEVKLDQIVYYIDAGTEYYFGKFGGSVV